MPIGVYRPTKLVIDCEAIRYNIQAGLAHLNDGMEIFAVLKANGYGHGPIESARAALAGGATGLCVSLLDEALNLRKAGFTEPILIMGIVNARYADILAKENISVAVTTNEWLKSAEKRILEKNIAQPLKLHIKIDTGMGRIGYTNVQEMHTAQKIIKQSDVLELEGIFTHYAKADDHDMSYYELQTERFQEALKEFPTTIRYVHTQNSAASLWQRNSFSNMVRYGMSMYGPNPSGATLDQPFHTKHALSLVTEIEHIKKMKKGSFVGYSATYQLPEDEWIATIPIGYGDGFSRAFQGFSVLVDGKKAPLVGRICMDTCMIRLPKEYPLGTKVTIFGSNGSETNTLQEAAEYTGTIVAEIIVGLTERIERVYINKT